MNSSPVPKDDVRTRLFAVVAMLSASLTAVSVLIFASIPFAFFNYAVPIKEFSAGGSSDEAMIAVFEVFGAGSIFVFAIGGIISVLFQNRVSRKIISLSLGFLVAFLLMTLSSSLTLIVIGLAG